MNKMPTEMPANIVAKTEIELRRAIGRVKGNDDV